MNMAVTGEIGGLGSEPSGVEKTPQKNRCSDY